MEKVYGEIAHDFFSEEDFYISGIGKTADHCCLDIPPLGKGEELAAFFRSYGQAHPLLGFGYKDLPWGKSRVFQGAAVQVDTDTAALVRHFAQGRGQPTGSIIGDTPVQLHVQLQ